MRRDSDLDAAGAVSCGPKNGRACNPSSTHRGFFRVDQRELSSVN